MSYWFIKKRVNKWDREFEFFEIEWGREKYLKGVLVLNMERDEFVNCFKRKREII